MQTARWVLFFSLNLAILYAWYAQLAPTERRPAARLLIASVLAMTQIILTIFALGLAFKSLTALNLSLLNLTVSAGLLVRAGFKRRLNAWREASGALRGAASIVRSSPLLKILTSLAIVAILWLVFLGIVYPPIEWDSLMYHLPATGYYMQQQSLADPVLPTDTYGEPGARNDSIWIIAFPKNIELFFLWTTLLSGTDVITDLVELGFGLLGIVAVYALAIKFGIPRKWSIMAGLLFFLTPVVLAQSRSNLIDLSNSVLILIALVLLYPVEKAKPFDIAVAGLAAGIVLGAKWSGIVFLAWLWFLLIGQRLYLERSNIKLKPALLKLASDSALFVGPALFLGGYWYLKNWYLYANPLWPFKISVFGRPLFNGLVAQAGVLSQTLPRQLKGLSAVGRLWVSWREPFVNVYDPAVRPGGLGPFWFIFALPAIGWLIKRAWSRRAVPLVILMVAAAGMLILHPENWWTRYTLFLVGIGAAAFAFVRSEMSGIKSALIVDAMVVFTTVYSIFVTFAPAYYSPAKMRALLATPPLLRTGGMIRPGYISKAYDYIAAQTMKAPANVGYGSGIMLTYPLWGAKLQNRVFFVGAGNRGRWEKRLAAKRIEYLLVNVESPDFRFVENRPGLKRTFFDRKWGYAVYEFRDRTAKR